MKQLKLDRINFKSSTNVLKYLLLFIEPNLEINTTQHTSINNKCSTVTK